MLSRAFALVSFLAPPFLLSSPQELTKPVFKRMQLVRQRLIRSPYSKKAAVRRRTEQEHAPLFVLQVGPSKTGTSTLQYFVGNNLDLFEKDNIYYVGHYKKNSILNLHAMAGACYRCDDPNLSDECDSYWEDLEDTINYHHGQNHSVLAIEEMFSAFPKSQCEQEHLWDRLIPLLSRWRVRIVYNYRHYYEWMPSQYVQLYNPAGCGQSVRKIRNRQRWPDEGGKPIPPFHQFFDGFGDHNFRNPPVISAKWKAHFDNVWVFNMHMDGTFLSSFFCNMLPEAASVCQHLKEDNEAIVMNPSSSKNLHYDMLSVEAYERRWIDKDLSRVYVNEAVEKHAKELGFEKLMDFPTKCLSREQLDKLLDKTLKHEADLLPDLFSSANGEAALRKGFEEAMEKGKFCSVDVEKVLQDSSWQQFFTDLAPQVGSGS